MPGSSCEDIFQFGRFDVTGWILARRQRLEMSFTTRDLRGLVVAEIIGEQAALCLDDKIEALFAADL